MLSNQVDQGIDYLTQAEDYYKKYCEGSQFYNECLYYMENGYYLVSPHFFLMAKGVSRDSKETDILHPWIKIDIDKCDTLYINLFIGDLSHAMSIIPQKFKYLCFMRNGDGFLRFYKTSRILNKVK